MAHLFPFVGTTFLLAMLPGVGQALMTKQALDGGHRPALASALGTALGLLCWSSLAGAGLSAVLLGNPSAFLALRVLGGVVLVVIGVRTVVDARRTAASDAAGGPEPAHDWSTGRAVLAALLVNLGNPKAGVFAVALLPQFVTDPAHVFRETVLLGLVWGATTFAWYLLFTSLVVRGRRLFASTRARRRLGLTSGGVLVTVGIAVAAGL
jgi:threonine/homoserine/homoserine lactone efflux protein